MSPRYENILRKHGRVSEIFYVNTEGFARAATTASKLVATAINLVTTAIKIVTTASSTSKHDSYSYLLPLLLQIKMASTTSGTRSHGHRQTRCWLCWRPN